jgi:hypothetical protein
MRYHQLRDKTKDRNFRRIDATLNDGRTLRLIGHGRQWATLERPNRQIIRVRIENITAVN